MRTIRLKCTNQKSNQKVKANIYSMKSTFTFLLALFFFACGDKQIQNETVAQADSTKTISRSNKTFVSDCRILLQEAKMMDSILLGQTEIDMNSANKAIVAFADFANYCHQDSLSPIYLIKCAQVARAINNIPQAKLVLEKCIQDYPNFRNRPAALFLLAQLYDEDTYLNNEIEAKRLYQQIIDEHPKSDWAMSAKGAISFLGKSDEQILQELKKTNKK